MTEICRKWMKLYYKGRVSAATVMLLLAVGMTGCGKDTGAAEQPEEITAEADEAGVEENKLPETLENEDAEKKNPETDREEQTKPKEEKPKKEEASKDDGKGEQTEKAEQNGPETESQPQAGTAELTGSVHSVGTDSFVVSQTTTEHLEDGDIEVGVAPGAPGEVLVTVYVTDAAVYEYRTVKNGGVNPEDITSREGSYGDLQEGLSVILKGHWEKDSFYADDLVIMKFT